MSKLLQYTKNGWVEIAKNGKDADEQAIAKSVLEQIPIPKDGSPDTKEQVRDKLEELVDGEKLSIQAIQDLVELLEELRAEVKKASTRRLGMRKVPIVKAVDLTASVDGATTTFTLPNDTKRVLGVWSTQFPVTFRENVDWTFAGRTLTLVTSQIDTPQSGQTLWALVETLFY